MNIADRILEIRLSLKMNKVQFGKLIGVSHTAVAMWESGETKSIKYEMLSAIEKKTDFRKEWISQGKLPKKCDGVIEKTVNYLSNVGKPEDFRGRLPLISFVRAGNWDEVMNPYELNDAEDFIDWPYDHGKRDYLLRNQGLSMFNPKTGDGYPDGCLLHINPDVEAENGDDVVVATPDGEVTFKELIKTNEGYFLQAINPDWPGRIMKIPEGSLIKGVCMSYSVSKRRRK